MKEKDISVYISRMERTKKYSREQLKLMEEDLQYGLDIADVERYCKPEYDYSQMEVYSRCMRSGYSDEVIAAICREGLSGQQMKVAREYFEKGISIETVKQIADGSLSAASMQKAYLGVLEKLEEAQKAASQEPEYVKALMEEIRNVIDKIDYQEKRYDAMNGKLMDLEFAKKDRQEKDKLEAEIKEKDRLLCSQQDSINQANAALARLRKENEELKEGIKKMEKQQDAAEKETGQARENGRIRRTGGIQEINRFMANKSDRPTEKDERTTALNEFGKEGITALLSGYQVAISDPEGNVVASVPIDKKKQGKSVAAHIFSRIVNKKRPKQNIIRKVISGELDKEQLMQIRNAMEKGLSEKQLAELIDSGLSAGQMEEIIEIAVLENSLSE